VAAPLSPLPGALQADAPDPGPPTEQAQQQQQAQQHQSGYRC
jgi:hypothetical protein